jgi:hypothetical protein
VVSTGVRRLWFIQALVMAVIATACEASETAPDTSAVTSSVVKPRINPARISRTRGDLPAGYEVADVDGPSSPVAFWGFKPGWTTEPPQCGILGGPVVDNAPTKGWSASGPGGIVHTVVTGSPATPIAFDPSVLTDCSHWTVASGNASGTTDLVAAPAIVGATTVGMNTVAKTVVEGGTETTAAASTFSAYLGDYLAFVTVVTDPGSPNPALGQEFAADLLVKTVSALRD